MFGRDINKEGKPHSYKYRHTLQHYFLISNLYFLIQIGILEWYSTHGIVNLHSNGMTNAISPRPHLSPTHPSPPVRYFHLSTNTTRPSTNKINNFA